MSSNISFIPQWVPDLDSEILKTIYIEEDPAVVLVPCPGTIMTTLKCTINVCEAGPGQRIPILTSSIMFIQQQSRKNFSTSPPPPMPHIRLHLIRYGETMNKWQKLACDVCS